MPYEERIYKLMLALEKQKAIHLENMQAHKKQAEFSNQSAEACLISIVALDIEIGDLKNVIEPIQDEESK